jgi:hypothetical protein
MALGAAAPVRGALKTAPVRRVVGTSLALRAKTALAAVILARAVAAPTQAAVPRATRLVLALAAPAETTVAAAVVLQAVGARPRWLWPERWPCSVLGSLVVALVGLDDVRFAFALGVSGSHGDLAGRVLGFWAQPRRRYGWRVG